MDPIKEAMIADDDGRSAPANKPANATPFADLERQIMSASVPKNEREWWAAREIEKLRDAIRRAVHDLPAISCGDGEFFYSSTIRVGLQYVLPPTGSRWLDPSQIERK